jgi:uncharacterized protein (TIGR02147 family)
MVITGSRNLTEKSGRKVSRALELNKEESDFFKALIKFNETEDLDEKNIYYAKLLRMRSFQKAQKSESFVHEFYSHWYNAAILEALGTHWRKKKPQEMADSLGISLDELKLALKTLSKLGLIEKTPKGWITKESSFEVAPGLMSFHIRNFHKEMISRALESVENLEVEQRNLSSVTIALSDKNYEDFCNRLDQFSRDCNALYSADANPEKVYQFNFQVFPLLKLS